jgi:hypothetical protein
VPWLEIWVRLDGEKCRHAGSYRTLETSPGRDQEAGVSASVLDMSMSFDGYIAGPDDGPGNPGGDGFMRLHEWLATADGASGRPPGPAGELYDEMEATRCGAGGPAYRGAGRSLQRQSSRRAGRGGQPPAAGDRDVMVHGAYTARRALQAGVLDELQIHQIPALPGQGLRLFDVLPSHVELEIARVSTRRRPPTSATASAAEPGGPPPAGCGCRYGGWLSGLG